MKTYDPEIDELLEKLRNPWETHLNFTGYVKVVDAELAERAAEMIFTLYERLASFEAEDYNRQIGGY
jgi:hypothetical protein